MSFLFCLFQNVTQNSKEVWKKRNYSFQFANWRNNSLWKEPKACSSTQTKATLQGEFLPRLQVGQVYANEVSKFMQFWLVNIDANEDIIVHLWLDRAQSTGEKRKAGLPAVVCLEA